MSEQRWSYIKFYVLLPLGIMAFLFASVSVFAWARRESELNKPVSIVNVYDTNGKLTRSLKGKINESSSDGNKVTITVDGKEYVFYNCNIETFEAPKECTSSVPAVSSSVA